MRNLFFMSSIELEIALPAGNAMSCYTYCYGAGRTNEFYVVHCEGDVKVRKLYPLTISILVVIRCNTTFNIQKLYIFFHGVFICFVWFLFLQETAVISLCSISRVTRIMEADCFLYQVGTAFLNVIQSHLSLIFRVGKRRRLLDFSGGTPLFRTLRYLTVHFWLYKSYSDKCTLFYVIQHKFLLKTAQHVSNLYKDHLQELTCWNYISYTSGIKNYINSYIHI
jgi:hypothetical protein